MIVATENNTGVDVYYTDNGIAIEDEHITLQRYEVFTRNSYYLDGRPVIDFTGTRVLSNRPVSVYSGIGSANVYPEVHEFINLHVCIPQPNNITFMLNHVEACQNHVDDAA